MRCSCRRLKKCVSGRSALLVGLVCITLLHFYVLPNAFGYYNEECYLSSEQLDDFRYMVITICQIYEELNQTYWLDYGTLLGAVRRGDVLPHDADVDISRLRVKNRTAESLFGERFRQRLQDFGISGNARAATYKEAKADLFNWDVVVEKTGDSYKPLFMLRYHAGRETFLEGLKHLTAHEDLPKSLVLPTRKMEFCGRDVSVPCDFRGVLAQRYPLTQWIQFPYKWKCWLPWKRPPDPAPKTS